MNKKIREDFPFLKRKYSGKELAYLDNASTTQKPKVVIDAIADAYQNHYANIHRGVYDLSVEATNLYEGTRERVAKFIGAKDPAEIVFTRNTTESINLLAYCQGPTLQAGDEILLSEMEHHSNIVPWQLIAGRLTTIHNSQLTINKDSKIKIKYIPIDEEGRLNLAQLPILLNKKTKIVSLSLMSNVLGTINPIKKIALVVRRLAPSAVIIVDAAQAAGHIMIDVGDLGADFVAFSAHKMYGPTGVGVLWGKKALLEKLPPFMGGGDMILSVDFEKTTFNDLPWKFEAGTPNIADVIAFGESIKFVEKLGFEKIRKHEGELTRYLLGELSKIDGVKLYGPNSNEERPRQRRREVAPLFGRGPVIAFNVGPSTLRRDSGQASSGQVPIHPHDVASILSSEGVAIRSGHHCAQPLMKVLGVPAVCRASFGVYNTEEEVDRLVEGIRKVEKVFKFEMPKEKGESVGLIQRRNSRALA